MSKDLQELKQRWISSLRHKASTYEHSAKAKGEVVTSPSLDDICNEMEAYFTGLNNNYPIINPQPVNLSYQSYQPPSPWYYNKVTC